MSTDMNAVACDAAALPKAAPPLGAAERPEVSVVMPCLNEADTLATCIKKAQAAFRAGQIRGEIIVADNGSTDGSQEIAVACGARVVPVVERGYGNALMGGIAAARGQYIVMGDADDSYDFGEIPQFINGLRAGKELVQGCRLPSGGGRVLPGAMPFLHRWLGNPVLSFLARGMFHTPVRDIYCGLRGFTKELYQRLDLRCTGMEFATEMIIKASLHDSRIGEVPITLHPDGRKSHPPHLRTFRDGWRTLRFFLMYSPRWLFLVPGMLFIAIGLLGYAIALPGIRILGVSFDAHTLLFASLAILTGYEAVLFALFTKVFTIREGLLPQDARLTWFCQVANLERGILFGATAWLIGLILLLTAIAQWWRADFGPLNYAVTMRWVIPGVTLTALGFQTVLASFFLGILSLARR
jgi:glycosyltransferase involved in cell wall biosynthesis